jgi:chemotaxis protein MotB
MMISLSPQENAREWIPLKRNLGRPLRLPDNHSRSEKGHDIWLLTLSDLLLLLMIFFILLFGITFQQQQQTSISPEWQIEPPIKSEETSVVIPPKSSVSPEWQMEPPIKSEETSVVISPTNEEDSYTKGKLMSLETDLRAMLGNEKGMEELIVTREAKRLVLTFPERIVFDPGQAQLKSGTRPILNKVASFVSAHPYLLVEVQGHTDDRPINTKRYPSNWELSVDRAVQVVRALIGLGLDPAHISLKGFGEYRTLYPNDSDANRQKNRRVEIQFSLPPNLNSSPPLDSPNHDVGQDAGRVRSGLSRHGRI